MVQLQNREVNWIMQLVLVKLPQNLRLTRTAKLSVRLLSQAFRLAGMALPEQQSHRHGHALSSSAKFGLYLSLAFSLWLYHSLGPCLQTPGPVPSVSFQPGSGDVLFIRQERVENYKVVLG